MSISQLDGCHAYPLKSQLKKILNGALNQLEWEDQTVCERIGEDTQKVVRVLETVSLAVRDLLVDLNEITEVLQELGCEACDAAEERERRSGLFDE